MIQCGADERRRRGLDRAEPLFLPIPGQKCKRVPGEPPRNSRPHRGLLFQHVKKVRHCEEGVARRGNPVTFWTKLREFHLYLRDSHASVRTGSE